MSEMRSHLMIIVFVCEINADVSVVFSTRNVWLSVVMRAHVLLKVLCRVVRFSHSSRVTGVAIPFDVFV